MCQFKVILAFWETIITQYAPKLLWGQYTVLKAVLFISSPICAKRYIYFSSLGSI